MSNYILYAGLNFDYPPNLWRTVQWRKSAKNFVVWLSDAVDGWLDRSMPEAPDTWELDRARRDLKIG
jgi:hypothetical protein